MVRRAGNKDIAYRQILLATVKWLFPVGQVRRRFFFSFTTLTFHVAVIVVPIFLAGHIALWKSGIGLSWPAISNGLADVLTITAVATAALLVVQRATARDSRALSRFSDYVLPVVIAVPFVSGFLVMHPVWNPFSYDATLFVHVMSGNVLLVLIPMTKLSHMALLPTTQLVSELAWHFPPDAGSKVGVDLGKEGQPI
ncbi:MAG: hypothetical protein JSW71_00860 [Gemmatimonadota bacterium]|nr:MAG: hypothetical protein JSW71_00860 [Gemmatimonadota bacterium]